MLAWVWLGCGGGGEEAARPPSGPVDEDQDGVPARLDCDDGDRRVYPGAADTPYDGVDADCAGDDDFDADADGVRGAPGGGEDCNDANAAVSPANDEVPYDGLDNDCDPGTPDDDVDQDGFRSFEECDDADPGVFPGSPEVAFDGVDQDCDGAIDATAFGVVPWTFSTPGALRAIDTRDAVAVVFRADRAVRPAPATALDSVVVAVAIDHDARGSEPLAEPPNLVWGQGDDHAIRAIALTTLGDEVQVGMSWTAVGRVGFLGMIPLGWTRGVGWFPRTPSYADDVFQDHTAVDAWSDRGEVYVVGSGAGGVGWASDGGIPSPGGLSTAGAGGTATFRDPAAPDTFVACADACVSWRFDPGQSGPPTEAAAQPWSDRAVRASRTHGDGVVWWEGARGVRWTDPTAEVELAPGDRVDDADVVRDGDELFAFLLADGDLRLLRGPVGGPYAAVAMAPVASDGRGFDPTGVALVVRSDALFLAVSSRDDSGGADQDRVVYAVLAR